MMHTTMTPRRLEALEKLDRGAVPTVLPRGRAANVWREVCRAGWTRWDYDAHRYVMTAAGRAILATSTLPPCAQRALDELMALASDNAKKRRNEIEQ